MNFLRKDGVALAYEDTGGSLPAIVFIHGCSLDHHSFAPQVEFFRPTHRVVAVDLRGHGESDAPHQAYTVPGFADDLAWLCAELGLVRPVMVGHSMGGNVGLDFAACYPELLSSLMILDSTLFAPEAMHVSLQQLAEVLQGPDYLSAWQQALSQLCLPTDKRGPRLIASLQIPHHVLASAWPNHVTNYDATSAAAGCHIPVAYIGSIMPVLDLARFQVLTPQLVTAHTLGSGHFASLEVPGQINAMIADFIDMQEQ